MTTNNINKNINIDFIRILLYSIFIIYILLLKYKKIYIYTAYTYILIIRVFILRKRYYVAFLYKAILMIMRCTYISYLVYEFKCLVTRHDFAERVILLLSFSWLKKDRAENKRAYTCVRFFEEDKLLNRSQPRLVLGVLAKNAWSRCNCITATECNGACMRCTSWKTKGYRSCKERPQKVKRGKNRNGECSVERRK